MGWRGVERQYYFSLRKVGAEAGVKLSENSGTSDGSYLGQLGSQKCSCKAGVCGLPLEGNHRKWCEGTNMNSIGGKHI